MGRDFTVELAEALERWEGEQVAVRVVTSGDNLIAVFSGLLTARSREKHPELFWQVEPAQVPPRMLERRGIYAHPELVTDVRLRVGGFVVEYLQEGVTVNVRRIGVPSAPPSR